MNRTDRVLEKIVGKNQSKSLHINEIPIDAICPSPYQTRKAFNESKLKELAESIVQNGVLQPIVVRKIQTPGSGFDYELIVGERRLRASKIAGKTVIPAVVRQADDSDVKTFNLIENLQREDLNIIERINSIAAIKDDLEDKKRVAESTGLSVRTVERYLKIYREIKYVPELFSIFESQASAIDFKTAQSFAEVAGKIRKLQKSDKREYLRIIKKLELKGVKKIAPLLKKKFSTVKDPSERSKKNNLQDIDIKETAKAYIVCIRLPKEDKSTVNYEEIIHDKMNRILEEISGNACALQKEIETN